MHTHLNKDIHSSSAPTSDEIILELIGRKVGKRTERHSVAHVTIPRGGSSLLHYHPEAEESYFILKGQARMMLEEKDTIVGRGQAILIQPTRRHKIANVGQEDLEFLAICVPAWEPTNTVWPKDGAKRAVCRKLCKIARVLGLQGILHKNRDSTKKPGGKAAMSDGEQTGKTAKKLPQETLIKSALEGKLNAISGYDAIIWKVRAGYTAILYGALTLVVGTGGTSGIAAVMGDLASALRVFLLITGFSATASIIDYSYLQKKLRVIVARDALMDVALQPCPGDRDELKTLLHIAGETFVDSLPDEAQKEFSAKRSWNVRRILLPLYATAPVTAFLIYLTSLLSSAG